MKTSLFLVRNKDSQKQLLNASYLTDLLWLKKIFNISNCWKSNENNNVMTLMLRWYCINVQLHHWMMVHKRWISSFLKCWISSSRGNTSIIWILLRKKVRGNVVWLHQEDNIYQPSSQIIFMFLNLKVQRLLIFLNLEKIKKFIRIFKFWWKFW